MTSTKYTFRRITKLFGDGRFSLNDGTVMEVNYDEGGTYLLQGVVKIYLSVDQLIGIPDKEALSRE
jgi:hypothetical protein